VGIFLKEIEDRRLRRVCKEAKYAAGEVAIREDRLLSKA
jgi:hypothetical protein